MRRSTGNGKRSKGSKTEPNSTIPNEIQLDLSNQIAVKDVHGRGGIDKQRFDLKCRPCNRGPSFISL